MSAWFLCNIMIQSTALFNAYLEGTKINTEVNERSLKNSGTLWFQRVPVSFSLAHGRPHIGANWVS